MKYHELTLVGEQADTIEIETEDHYWDIWNEVVAYMIAGTEAVQAAAPEEEHRVYLRLPIVFEEREV